jgi:hypothetical protein
MLFSELQAAGRATETEVHVPLERVVSGRQWENVHFVGLLPDYFHADDVLGPIAANGTGTVEVEVNADPNGEGLNNLFGQVMEAIYPDEAAYARNPAAYPYAGQFRVTVAPTRTLRILDETDGRLAYTLDHADPALDGFAEHTLVLFRNKPDGSPSDRFLHYQERYGQARREAGAA